MFSTLGLGLGLVAAGLLLAALVWGVLRLVPGPSGAAAKREIALPLDDPGAADEALILIAPGGRVEYINARARQWFAFEEDARVDLERLLRAVTPADDFLALCAAPGRKRLIVDRKPVEVDSHHVPGAHGEMLISMRRAEPAPFVGDDAQGPSGSQQRITDFDDPMTSSLDLDVVLRSLAVAAHRLFAVDMLEIRIWDEAGRAFVVYASEEQAETGPNLLRPHHNSSFGSLGDPVIETRAPVFLADAGSVAAAQTTAGTSVLNSYIAIPLIADDDLVGVVEVGRFAGTAFTPEEFDLLQVLGVRAAPPLRNALRYESERHRALELSGLANVAQAVTAMSDPGELFARLVESVVPLFDVHILGFLLYDESHRRLAAEVPFHGLVQSVVEVYRAEVPAGAAGEALLHETEPLLTTNAGADEKWRLLGLADVAVAASLRDSALVPLLSSGRMLGFLQVSNHRGGARAFSKAEVRLMQVVAKQAASIIENTRLLWQRSEQLRRSESARTLSDTAASAATVDEALTRGLSVLGGLFNAQLAVALLLEETRGLLEVHRDSAQGLDAGRLSSIPMLTVDQPDFALTVTGARRPWVSGRLSLEAQLQPFYRRILDGLGLESVAIVPLVAHGKSMGELILGNRRTEFFTEADVGLLTTAGTQLASTIEGLRLAAQTDPALRRQVERMISMGRVSREIAGSTSLEHLLSVIHDELIRLVGADCGSVLLSDPSAGSSGQGRSRSVGCRSGDELSRMEQLVLEARQPLSIADFGGEEFPPPHSGVKSALVIPLIAGDRAIGLLQLHAPRVVAFDAAAAEMVQTLAAQAAVALTNAASVEAERRQAEVLRRRAGTLEILSKASGGMDPEQPPEEALARVAQGIRESTPFRIVHISVYEPDTGTIRPVAGAGIATESLAELQARKQPLSTLQQLLRPEFKISRSYYVPADRSPAPPADSDYAYAGPYSVTEATRRAWHADDALLVPLEDSLGAPLGVISVDDPGNGLRPDRATIESLELFAAQASRVIQESRRMRALTTQIDSLSSALDRQQRLLSVTQSDLPVLLRKDLEQTIALHDLDGRARRIRAGLRIIESVSRQLDGSSALQALARETLTQLGMATALLAENTPDGPRLVRVVGAAPAGTNAEALFGQRNPLRLALQTGAATLVADLEESDEWRHAPLLTQLRARGIVCLPLLVADRAVAAMLAISTEPLPPFTDEDRQVYQQISRQASVILQNIALLAETRGRLQEVNILLEFSRRLTGLDSSQILNALLESARHAVKAAHAGVVLVWNEDQRLLEAQRAAGYADDQAMLEISYRQGEALPGKVFASGQPQRADEIDFRRDYLLKAEALGRYRQATGGRLPVSSLLVPILIEGRSTGLVVLDNFNTPAAFSGQDEALAVSLVQQAALSLENVRLFAETQQLAQQMEQRVIERTAELSREQQHTEALLRKEQEDASRSQAILESVADAVVVTGPDNRVTFLNASVQRVLAADADQLLGEPVEALGELFGEAGSAWLETIRRWSAPGGIQRAGDTYAARLELGDDRIALIHLAPVILGQDFLGTVSILRDITHEVEVDRLKSEFVATVSHELRTPMTSIKGYVEMLLMGAAGSINENQSHFLDIIKRNSDRLNTLVDGLLDISRIESGKVSITHEALELAELAREAIGEMQRRSGQDQKPMSFSLSIGEGLPQVRGDAQRVRQIVLSLMANAYQYTPANGSVAVQLNSVKDGRQVQLDITDNGVGIPRSDQARIFERFFRGEDPLVLAAPGAGLGLAIARQLVEMHGGRIWFHSEGVAGQGSIFSITLPAYSKDDEVATPEPRGLSSAPTAGTPPGDNQDHAGPE